MEQRGSQDRTVTKAPRAVTALWVLVDLGLCIRNVDRPPVKDGSTGWRLPNQWASLANRSRRNRTFVHDDAQRIRVDLEDRDINGFAEASRSLGDHIEYGLNIGWRAADGLEDVARGRLLLERLRLALQGLR